MKTARFAIESSHWARGRACSALTLTVFLLGTPASQSAHGQCTGQKLSAEIELVPRENRGFSVATTDEFAVVGYPDDDSAGEKAGAASVYHWEGDTWSGEQEVIASDAGAWALFGSSVALSGNVMVVGAPRANGAAQYSGAAYVFRRNRRAWVEEQKLFASDGWNGDAFHEVAVAGDTIVVGAPGADSAAGAAYVFHWNGSTWSEQQKLLARNPRALDSFGYSVSTDGKVILVGASREGTAGVDAGAAFPFRWNGSTWKRQKKLRPPNNSDGDRFGSSVSVSGDIAVVGAYRDDDQGTDAGAAWAFRWDGAIWSREQKLLPAGTGGFFGLSVSIEGPVALVGSFREDRDAGAAYLYRLDAGTWTLEERFTASDTDRGDRFGFSVSVCSASALLGTTFHNAAGEAAGAAYAYRFEAGSRQREQFLISSDSSALDHFGGAVALSGTFAAIGSPDSRGAGPESGAVHAYRFRRGAWVAAQVLEASDASAYDHYGQAVSVSGNSVVVGAPDAGSGVGRPSHLGVRRPGAVYVLHWDGTTFVEDAKLSTPDTGLATSFGAAVCLDGDTLAVGAPFDDAAGTDAGAVYLYRRVAGTWSFEQKLSAASGHAGAEFGRSVALQGDALVVGAPLADAVATESGAAFVYRRSGAVWVEEQVLEGADGLVGDQFGCSVGLSETVVVVGAPQHDEFGPDSGAAYLFVREESDWTFVEKLRVAGHSGGDRFGQSVAASDVIVVGAPGRNYDQGSAFQFIPVEGRWQESEKLFGYDSELGDLFGSAVACSGQLTLVGAPAADFDSRTGVGRDIGSAFAFCAPVLGQVTRRVSVDSNGDPGGGASDGSSSPSVSLDGRFVAFASPFSCCTDDPIQVHVHDRQTGLTALLSRNWLGYPGKKSSSEPAISTDGRHVAFSSRSRLVRKDRNECDDGGGGRSERDCWDIYVRDRDPDGDGIFDQGNGVTFLLSANSRGRAVGQSYQPSISADGRLVAFASEAENLVASDTNLVADVFVHDRDPDGNGVFDEGNGVISRVSVSSSGTQGNFASEEAVLSADGRTVVFTSNATNLIAKDSNTFPDIFAHDRLTGAVVRLSETSAGIGGDSWTGGPAASADGRHIAFRSSASNLVTGDLNGTSDVFVHDRDADGNGIFDEGNGVITRVSLSSAGKEGSNGSHGCAISADGRRVAFLSYARNLVWRDTNELMDAFARDRDPDGNGIFDEGNGETRRVSVSSSGVEAEAEILDVAISPDGRHVSFSTSAANLVPDDEKGFDYYQDVFVHGPELTLSAVPEVSTGQTLTLSTWAGRTGDSAYLTVQEIDGLSVPHIIAQGTFEFAVSGRIEEGTKGRPGVFEVTQFAPPGLAGHTITYRAYGTGPLTRRLVSSNEVVVEFR